MKIITKQEHTLTYACPYCSETYADEDDANDCLKECTKLESQKTCPHDGDIRFSHYELCGSKNIVSRSCKKCDKTIESYEYGRELNKDIFEFIKNLKA